MPFKKSNQDIDCSSTLEKSEAKENIGQLIENLIDLAGKFESLDLNESSYDSTKQKTVVVKGDSEFKSGRRKYTDAIKGEYLRLVNEEKLSGIKAAAKLNIPSSTGYNWLKKSNAKLV